MNNNDFDFTTFINHLKQLSPEKERALIDNLKTINNLHHARLLILKEMGSNNTAEVSGWIKKYNEYIGQMITDSFLGVG